MNKKSSQELSIKSTTCIIAFFPFCDSLSKFSSPYNGIINAFENLGIKLKIIIGKYLVGNNMREFNHLISEEKIIKFIDEQKPLCVVSINNHGMSKKIRDNIKVPVVKWIFDDLEHNFLHRSFGDHEKVFYPNDICITYSSALAEKIKQICPDLKTNPVFLPHATSMEIFKSNPPKQTKEISFIGSYLDVGPVLNLLQYFGEYGDTFPKIIFSLMEDLRNNRDLDFDNKIKSYNIKKYLKTMGINLLDFKRILSDVITTQDRLAAIAELEDMNIKVYGRNDWLLPLLYQPKISDSYQFAKKLDDQKSLINAYQNSSITIDVPNVQNKTAISGRVIEAMASGALLVTKYQEGSDLYKIFGENCPVPTYHTLQELKEICHYYAANEPERLNIVKQCNKLVSNGFDFKDRVLQILQAAGIKIKTHNNYIKSEIVPQEYFGKSNISKSINFSEMEIREFEKLVLNKIANNELQEALVLMISYVQHFFNDPRTLTNVYGSQRLDKLCLSIGMRLNNYENNYAKLSTTSVYIASHLSGFGGHTHVLENMIKSEKSDKKIILLTDLFNHAEIEKLKLRFSEHCEFRAAPLGDALLKLKWLAKELKEIKPKNILLFNHHEDAVIIAATAPWLQSSQVFFIHHADTNLTFGTHLPLAKHIDLHNIGYFCCQEYEQIKDNKYLPLTIMRKERRPNGFQFKKNGALRTCSSGTYNKFSAKYNFAYFDFVIERLKAENGVHIHIGTIPPQALLSINAMLAKNEIGNERFIYIPWVPSVWRALIEHEVDLYISSFPLSGGLATLEAMGSGTPILAHQSNMSRFHGGADLMYPSVFIWRDMEEFTDIITSLTDKQLAQESENSVNWFEKHYTQELMTAQLNALLSGSADVATPPPLKEYTSDSLERFLQFSNLVNNNPSNYDDLVKKDQLIQELLASTSWKITAPLRWLKTNLRN